MLADAARELEQLGERIGALLATSAPAYGLFSGLDYAVGIAGGFASPLASELLGQADLIIAFGASLNQWTTKHGSLFGAEATTIQVDLEPAAIGAHRPAQLGLLGYAHATAQALTEALYARNHINTGFRTPENHTAIATRTWDNEAYEDAGTDRYIDPARFRSPTAFRPSASASATLSAPRSPTRTARPSRCSATAARSWPSPNSRRAARLKLGNLLVVVYDDSAYGAEVHHFAAIGHDVSRVRFPAADLASIATAAGAHGQTVRRTEDLTALTEWLEQESQTPLVLDAKVNPEICAEWLEEAFRAG